MRIKVAIPNEHVTAPVLDAALEAVTRLDESMIRSGSVPLFEAAKSRVKWKPEPVGDEHFDHAGLVLARGWGDCDDMAPWRAASLRATGTDPGARAIVRPSGPNRWHAVVRRSDGSTDDPSRETGMGTIKNPAPGVFGAAIPMIGMSGVNGESMNYYEKPHISMKPIRRNIRGRGQYIVGWDARVDMPSRRGGVGGMAMSTSARRNCSSDALIEALEGALLLARHTGGVSGAAVERTAALRDACSGADWDEIAGLYGSRVADDTMHVVGGFFKKLAGGIKKVGKGVLKVAVSKFGRGLISMVPGVGPAAAAALDMAGPALKKMIDKGGKKPGSALAAQMTKMGATKLVKRSALPAGTARRVPAGSAHVKSVPAVSNMTGRMVTISIPVAR